MRTYLVVPAYERIQVPSALFTREVRVSFEELGLDRFDHPLSLSIGLRRIRPGELLNDAPIMAELSERALELFPVVRVHALDLEGEHLYRLIKCDRGTPTRLIRKDVGKKPTGGIVHEYIQVFPRGGDGFSSQKGQHRGVGMHHLSRILFFIPVQSSCTFPESFDDGFLDLCKSLESVFDRAIPQFLDE